MNKVNKVIFWFIFIIFVIGIVLGILIFDKSKTDDVVGGNSANNNSNSLSYKFEPVGKSCNKLIINGKETDLFGIFGEIYSSKEFIVMEYAGISSAQCEEVNASVGDFPVVVVDADGNKLARFIGSKMSKMNVEEINVKGNVVRSFKLNKDKIVIVSDDLAQDPEAVIEKIKDKSTIVQYTEEFTLKSGEFTSRVVKTLNAKEYLETVLK